MLRSKAKLRDSVAVIVRQDFCNSSSAAVAKQLNISDRTMRRHLAMEGVSFQEILNDLRYEQAQLALMTTQLSVNDIARQLGYSDASNFGHAFRQWSGMSPRQFRQQRRNTVSVNLAQPALVGERMASL
ncbi:MAG: helix-turn-helix transcriptional regulator [Pseudomonadales bacterium]|nr:helix-turn-helix transcriptional regulator [Pseudomonadales bacterium]